MLNEKTPLDESYLRTAQTSLNINMSLFNWYPFTALIQS